VIGGLQADDEFIRKLREAFAIEAEEHLQAITTGVLELEKSPAEERRAEIVETVFREAHSLKGAAGAVNRTDIASLCQALEHVFAACKRRELSLTANSFDTLNKAADFLARLLALPEIARTEPDKSDLTSLIAEVAQIAAGGIAKTRDSSPPVARVDERRELPMAAPSPHQEREKVVAPETVRVSMRKLDSLLLQAEEMVAVKLTAAEHASDLREMGESMKGWRKEWGKTAAEMRALRSEVEARQPKKASTARMLDFLDWNQSYMRSLESKLAALSKSAETSRRLMGGMVDELLEDAKRLVMLPFSTLLDLFPKLVRDLARDEGKEVELVVEGREVEIDKRILEEMKDPLIHLMRNAVDHGLEMPIARVHEGKAPQGELKIKVSQTEGNKVEILITDDGAGIDAAAVKASALKKGLITAEEAAHFGEREALAIIFKSDISTSAIVTEISGRGLGLAIVAEKVERLGGSVSVETKQKEGATFRILLPVTLATFQGLLVRASEQTFVIPVSQVDRLARVPRDDIKTVENRETIALNGRAVSLAWLADVLELPRSAQNEEKMALAVVLGAGGLRIAFLVDEVLNEQEVLVKPLQKPLVRVRNVAAATVLGSGKPALILNVSDLLKSAAKSARTAAAAARGSEARTQWLLVVEDSITSRMLLKNILESAGYAVRTAIDGVDALTALKSQPFDLVVSDVEMPRMDGFELCAKIRADKKLAELPLVLVTALDSREHREQGIDAGANAYIVKGSFDQSNLLEVIRRLI
jgi:two-component system chemotaxis sensor kinase CheA